MAILLNVLVTLIGKPGPAAAPASAKDVKAPEERFERVASLVLLALLCTTLAAVPL